MPKKLSLRKVVESEAETRFARACRWASRLFGKNTKTESEKRARIRKEIFNKKRKKFRIAEQEFEEAKKRFAVGTVEYSRAKQRYRRALNAFRKAEEDYTKDDYTKALKFCRLDIEPWNVVHLAYFCALVTFVLLLGLLFMMIIVLNVSLLWLLLYVLIMFLLPVIVIYVVVNYPLYVAKRRRIATLAKMPEAINYMVMSMYLSPSLERAVEYAADSVEEPLASDMKRIIWNVQMRKYDTIEESLIAFADEWGEWSDEFRRAIYSVRAAALERTEEGVRRALEKANETVVEGTRAKIESFADALSMPVMLLFSFIILPVMLAALLPIFVISTTWLIVIFFLLDVVFPLTAIAYSYHVLGSRPAITAPLKIDTLLGIKEQRQTMLLAIGSGMLFVGLGTFFRDQIYLAALFLVWSIGLPIALYSYLTAFDTNRERVEIMKLEEEFPAAMFQLGSRITEGKPLEQALEKVAIAMKRTRVVEYLQQIIYNMHVTRASLKEILFGPEGIMTDFPSRMIRASMHTIVESVKKDNITAGKTIVGIANYLRDLKKVEANMKLKLRGTINMMMITSLYIAPLVLGITLVLYKVLAGYFSTFSTPMTFGLPISLGGTPIDPFIFSLLIGIYLIMVVLITIYFSVGIEYGDDWIARKMQIGIYLPISLLIYSFATLFSHMIFGSL